MDKNVKAKMQILDSYVKEISITCLEKISNNNKLDLNGQVNFRIVNIEEKENELIGQIEFINDIELNIKDENKSKIHVLMVGVFKGINGINKKEFESMLKINGASTLSHLTRAYINAITSLGGMPPILTPMINFYEFFKNEEEEEK